MQETSEERAAILQRMRDASNRFYSAAAAAGCHAFIEFTGLMNEYIELCHEANEAGIPWVHANVHGDVHLPWKPWHIEYLSEKLECIYGRRLADGSQEQNGVEDCIAIVERRQAHYEMYRCNCERRLDSPHRAGCPGEMMATHPATFAVLDEILVFLRAHLERLRGRSAV